MFLASIQISAVCIQCMFTSNSSAQISLTSSDRYARDRVSAIISSFPGRYFTVIGYFWIVMIIFCSLVSAWCNDFVNIISRGLWSASTSILRSQNMYSWNLVHSKTIANSVQLRPGST